MVKRMNKYSYIMLDTDGGELNDVWISNNLGASWQLSTGNAGWTARYGMAAVSIGGTMFLMGGWDGECIYI